MSQGRTTAVHIVASLGENAGGPSRTVPGLCRALANSAEVVPRIITGSNPAFGENVIVAGVHQDTLDAGAGVNQFFEAISRCQADAPWLIHDHGQWLAANRASAKAARHFHVPRIVTPRGMLSPWAMRYKRWKKMLAWYAYARRDVHSADVLHATSQLEAQELRTLGLSQPIAIVPNGVDDIDLSLPLELPPGIPDRRLVVFMSRIHPKKGVPELIRVWNRMKLPDWALVLAGPDETGMLPSLLRSSSENIFYTGSLAGNRKNSLLRQASLFVLPSYSENFGVVVAEALMAETPVITTNATPWQILNSEGAGWCGDVGEHALERMLTEAVSLSPKSLQDMGQRGRLFVREKYSWESIGVDMARVYRWMFRMEPKPDCIMER